MFDSPNYDDHFFEKIHRSSDKAQIQYMQTLKEKYYANQIFSFFRKAPFRYDRTVILKHVISQYKIRNMYFDFEG
jgi:hypothetical protein